MVLNFVSSRKCLTLSEITWNFSTADAITGLASAVKSSVKLKEESGGGTSEPTGGASLGGMIDAEEENMQVGALPTVENVIKPQGGDSKGCLKVRYYANKVRMFYRHGRPCDKEQLENCDVKTRRQLRLFQTQSWDRHWPKDLLNAHDSTANDSTHHPHWSPWDTPLHQQGIRRKAQCVINKLLLYITFKLIKINQACFTMLKTVMLD